MGIINNKVCQITPRMNMCHGTVVHHHIQTSVPKHSLLFYSWWRLWQKQNIQFMPTNLSQSGFK